jgi:two-component system chemotaxis response regulator CheY
MKVLIVDDSEMLQTRLQNALIKIDKSIELTQAHNCEQAMDLFSPLNPDRVILDIALPDGSGINLLKKFRERYPDVEVFILTNYPTPEFKKSCLALGAKQFFDKSNLNGLLGEFKLV